MKLLSILLVTVWTSLFFSSIAVAQERWQSANFGAYAGAIQSVAALPTGRLIASTIWDGLYISDDHGTTWTASNNGFTGIENRLVTLKVIGSKVFAVGLSGLFVSDDDGNNWSPSTINGTLVRGIISSGSNIVVATGSGNYYSSDNGTTWALVNGLNYTNMVAFTHLGTILFAVGDNRVFQSTDDGVNWVESNPIYPSNISSHDIIAVGGSLLCTTNIGIFRSNDAGGSWNYVDAAKRSGSLAIINGSLFLGTSSNIYKSDDDGLNWTTLYSDLNNSNVSQFVESNGDIFAPTAKAGMLFSSDNGVTWSRKDSGMVRPHINMLAAEGTTFIAATNSGLHISVDEAKTWSTIPGTTSRRYTSIVATENRFIAGTDSNGIYISDDHGATWTNSNSGLTNININTLAYVDDRLWCGTQSRLFFSNDHGNTWQQGNVTGNITTIIGKNNFVYVRLSQQGMQFSDSYGINWRPANTGLPSSFSPTINYLTMLGNKIYYYDGAYNRIYETNLGSVTWTIYQNTEGNGMSTDGAILFYGPSSTEIIGQTGLSSVSFGYPSHLISDRARFSLPFKDRLYVCFNSVLYTGPEAGVIYSKSIADIPGISEVFPLEGNVGDTITITGNNLDVLPKRVFFNDLEGTILSSAPTSWTVSVPPTGGEATIIIVIGSLEASLANKFRIFPEMKSITPDRAIVGTQISIEGTGLDPNQLYAVSYGIYFSEYVKPNSSGKLVTKVPDLAYKGPITLTSSTGLGTRTTTDFTILPHIIDFSPKQIQPSQLVTITGSGFPALPENIKVSFNGSISTDVLRQNKNSLQAVAPSDITSGLISITAFGYTSTYEIPYSVFPTAKDCTWGPLQPQIMQVGLVDSTYPILSSNGEGGNTWYYNDEKIENDGGRYIIALKTGVYTLKVIVDGCPSPISTPFNVNILVTGLPDDEPSKASFDIYPNPFERELTIDLGNTPDTEWVNVTITNQLGIQVYHQKLQGGQTRKIDVNHFNAGLYFIRIETPYLYVDKKMIKR